MPPDSMRKRTISDEEDRASTGRKTILDRLLRLVDGGRSHRGVGVVSEGGGGGIRPSECG